MALTGEVHGEKESIDVTPGSHVTWNWGISQYLPLAKDESVLLEIGPIGYSQWQVSDDRGRAARNRSVHDEVHAAGLQLGLTHARWAAFLTARYLQEFGAQDRFEGRMVRSASARSSETGRSSCERWRILATTPDAGRNLR